MEKPASKAQEECPYLRISFTYKILAEVVAQGEIFAPAGLGRPKMVIIGGVMPQARFPDMPPLKTPTDNH
jgi:hypothetical protein